MTAGNGTAVTGVQQSTGGWRRVSESLETQTTLRFNADVASSEALDFELPNALQPLVSNDARPVGVAELWNGSTVTTCIALVYDTGRIKLDCQRLAATAQIGEVTCRPSKAPPLVMT